MSLSQALNQFAQNLGRYPMGRRLQGRRDSGGDDEEIQTHTGVAEKAYP